MKNGFKIRFSLSLFFLTAINLQAAFKDKVLPFMEKYCYSCHDTDTAKGDLDLEAIQTSPATDKNVAVWMEVMVHLREKTMPPPKKKKQPAAKELFEVKELVEKELFKSKIYRQRIQKPEYANYLEHRKLFDPKRKTKAYTLSRLWRRNPFIYDELKKSISKRKMDGVKQPFDLEEKQQIRDYAALMYADSATLDTMMRNAEFIVDQLLAGARVEDWKIKNNGQLPPEYQPYEEVKNGKKKTIRPRLPERTYEEFSKIVLSTEYPSEEDLKAAIQKQFAIFIQKDPVKRDYMKYTYLFKKNHSSSGNYEALRGMLVAIAISPEAIYRKETGLGPVDDFGRRRLSQAELAFALSFALLDKPEPGLIEAAKKNKLSTSEDLKRELNRILYDESIEKPRLLRFFHEFFGYTHAPKVFKDDRRFVSRYTYDTLSQYMVSDADLLVKHIIDQDKDVLRQLLTTDKYFVAHTGDNEAMKNEVGAMYAVYDIIKDFKQKFPYHIDELQKGLRKKVTEAGEKFGIRNYRHFNGNTATRLKNKVSLALSKGLTPIPAHRNINYIHAYNLVPEEWDFQAEQPAKMPNSPRAGILTHPAWLIAYSQNLDNDPVRRGKWVRERLLAGTIPDLPVTVDAKIPEDPHKTLRQRMSVTESPECWKCHRKMNSLGNAFEMYDDFGKYRQYHFINKKNKEIVLDTEHLKNLIRSKRVDKLPVDSSGEITLSFEEQLDGEVKNAIELMNKLGNSTIARQSFIRHVFRFYLGRNETYNDAPVLVAADKAYVESGGSFKALLVSLLTSDSFIYRKRLNNIQDMK